MRQHLSEEELKGYGRRVMTASALLDADRHLAQCAQCRAHLLQTAPPPALPPEVLGMGEPLHLTYEQMTAHVDARLNQAELAAVEQHQSICRRCARELAELHAFDARMATGFAASPASQAAATESWRSRLYSGVERFFLSPPRLRFAGAGAALMALGVFSLLRADVPITGNTRTGTLMHLSGDLLAVSAAMHPHLFYGGFVVAGCGACALLYGLMRK